MKTSTMNPRRIRIAVAMLCGVLLLLPASRSIAQQPTESATISTEGKKQKAIHDYLFDTFAESRKTVYQGNGRDRGLKELTILDANKEDS